MYKLDIGAGMKGFQREPLDEWTHLDAMKMDHIEIVGDFGTIPLEDNSCSEIYIGDIIEHVPPWRYDEVLKEWNRVLVMGGRISGTCPNGRRAQTLYASGEIPWEESLQAIFGWNSSPTEHHYNCFNRVTLTTLLLKYGFDVKDYSGSPGGLDMPWWLVFTGKKVKDV